MLCRLVVIGLLCISSCLSAQELLIVGIAGGTGSGKTTFAKKIKDIFGEDAVLIEVDSYYRDLSHMTPQARKEVNFDHPDSIDFAALCQDLACLKQGTAIEKPIYDFKTSSRLAETQTVAPARIVIIEGVLLLSVVQARELCDIKLYIEVEDDIRLLRRLERDILERGRTLESTKKQYLATVKPMHDCFVAPSRIHADVIIPAVGDTSEAEKIIMSRLKLMDH